MHRFRHTTGLIAAPHTPFTESGAVDFETIPHQIEAVAQQGVCGVFVNGTTGEGLSLTTEERKRTLELWRKHAPAGLKIIAHVGHHSVDEAAALSSHAASIGAHGVSTMGPSFLKPGSTQALVNFCRPIAKAAAELPFYYYHIPSLSGVALPMPDFLELGAEQIDNLAGIKFTHPDLFEFQRCRIVSGGRFDILWGVDEILLGALAVGATAAVGSTYNYAAPLYLRMIDAFQRGDLETARACSTKSVLMVQLLKRFGVAASGRALMSIHGVDCGPPRPPVDPISARDKETLLHEFEALDVFGA